MHNLATSDVGESGAGNAAHNAYAETAMARKQGTHRVDCNRFEAEGTQAAGTPARLQRRHVATVSPVVRARGAPAARDALSERRASGSLRTEKGPAGPEL
jgi:hypothetical protein